MKELRKIPKANNWSSAFVQANALLAEGELDALATMSESRFNDKVIEAISISDREDPWEELAAQEVALASKYGNKNSIELWHCRRTFLRNNVEIEGWVLVFVLTE